MREIRCGKASRMMTRAELVRLKQRVWQADSVRPVRIYAVLDCARDAAIYDLIGRSYREKGCLFAGKLDYELERAAPFLLELQPGDSVTDEILLRGWDSAWGILIRTEASFRSLRRHLRTYLRVRTEEGRFLLFRYYDPRVLDIYLPTCTGYELGEIFGDDITHIVVAAAGTHENRLYTLRDGALLTEDF
jgi:hypothetical protein